MRIVARSFSVVVSTLLLLQGDTNAWVLSIQSGRLQRRALLKRNMPELVLYMGPPKEEFLEDCDADPDGECEVRMHLDSDGLIAIEVCAVVDPIAWLTSFLCLLPRYESD